MRTNTILTFMALIAILSSCDFADNRLQVKNNSKEVVTVDFSEDTLLEKRDNDNIKFFIRDSILFGESLRKTMPGSINGWPFFIQRSKNKKLNVFFINVDTLIKYNNWDKIRENKGYCRKEYTLEELEKKGWVIEYP